MKIIKVEVFNIKGISEETELTGLDLIVGPNGSRKTTRLQAIEFCLTGRIGDSKKGIEIHSKFASGLKMKAVLHIGNYKITRELAEKIDMKEGVKSYKYKASASIEMDSGASIDGSKKCDEWIKNNINISSVVFNFGEFASMNSTERRNYFKRLVQFYEISKEEVMDYLRSKLVSEEIETDYLEVLNAAFTEIELLESDLTGEELLSELHDIASTRFVKYNEQNKNNSGAVNKITEIKNTKEGNVRKVSKFEKKHKANSEKITEYKVELQKSESVVKLRKEHQETISETKEKINKINKFDYKAAIDKTTLDIKDNEKLFIQLKKVPDYKDDIQNLTANLKKKKVEHEASNKIVQDVSAILISIDSDIKKHEQILEETKTEFKCPMTQKICNADLGLIQNSISGTIKELQIQKEDKLLEQTAAINKNVKLEGKIKDLENNIDELEKNISDVVTHNDNATEKNKIPSETGVELNQRLIKLKSTEENSDQRITEYSNEIKNLESYKYEEHEDPEISQSFIEGLQEENTKLEEDLKDLKEKQILLSTQMKAIEDNQLSATKLSVWKSIKIKLGPSGLQGELIKRNLGPIQEELSSILKDMGREETFEFRLKNKQGKEEFNFGWNRNGEMLFFDSLSGGEQITTAAAMLVIFQEQMNSDLKILSVDEVEKLYGDDRANFLRGIHSLKDRVDNIVLAGAIDTEPFEEDLFEVIDL